MRNNLFGLLIRVVTCCTLLCCQSESRINSNPKDTIVIDSPIIAFSKIPLADGFDFPVGPPNANAYYNATPFGSNLHLGDDWNGIGGGNSDLGDPVFSIGNGKVVSAEDYGGGWGKVIRIIHQLDSSSTPQQIESLYAHLDTMLVLPKEYVSRGDQIGTIGTADGTYLAHLHLEIRSVPGMPLGGGYSKDTSGYVDPTVFINRNRPSAKRSTQ